jgi:hypothetical protein
MLAFFVGILQFWILGQAMYGRRFGIVIRQHLDMIGDTGGEICQDLECHVVGKSVSRTIESRAARVC